MGTYDLNGKVALVTGAGRGIGLETARALTRRGAKVALLDLDQGIADDSAADVGGGAIGIGADVTDRAALERAVATVVERFGGLDVVVANAGITNPPQTARVADPDAFEKVIEVNLLGVWRTVNAALPQITARGGHVVVVSSIYAFANGVGQLPYAMAKAGVEQLGRGLRVELAPHGVGVTTAYFGFIDTEMVRGALDRNPLRDQLSAPIPKPLRKRLPPSAAGEGIVDAIAAREATVMLPRRWRALWVTRGVLGPALDAGMLVDRKARALVKAIDRRP
jgi:NAD(P)-dependent dehydrogenase (short-subunit alcohol dehydrogenase family)